MDTQEHNNELIDENFLTHGKVHSKSQFIWTAIFGGAFALAILFSRNFKVFKEENKIKHAWIIAGLYNMAIYALTFAFPRETDQIPNFFFSLITVILANLIFNHTQKLRVEEHIAKTGKIHSGGLVFLFIILGGILNLAFALLLFVIFDYDGLLAILQELQIDL